MCATALSEPHVPPGGKVAEVGAGWVGCGISVGSGYRRNKYTQEQLQRTASFIGWGEKGLLMPLGRYPGSLGYITIG